MAMGPLGSLRLRHLLDGPAPAWPAPLEAAAERWRRTPARLRLLVWVAVVGCLLVTTHLRVQAAESRWGGEPVPVLVATEDAVVGSPAATAVRHERLPPGAVPAQALAEVDDDAVLAVALPRGAVLTELHVDPRGPAAGLDGSLRAVPVRVEEGWGVTAGGWVDVWVDGHGDEPVARQRPVLDVRRDGSRHTALLGLHADEVGAVTGGAAREHVQLTHAPPPTPERQ